MMDQMKKMEDSFLLKKISILFLYLLCFGYGCKKDSYNDHLMMNMKIWVENQLVDVADYKVEESKNRIKIIVNQKVQKCTKNLKGLKSEYLMYTLISNKNVYNLVDTITLNYKIINQNENEFKYDLLKENYSGVIKKYKNELYHEIVKYITFSINYKESVELLKIMNTIRKYDKINYQKGGIELLVDYGMKREIIRLDNLEYEKLPLSSEVELLISNLKLIEENELLKHVNNILEIIHKYPIHKEKSKLL